MGKKRNLGYHFKSASELERTKVKEEDFEFIKVIGKGHFSRVYLVQHQSTGKYYALKKMKKDFIVKEKMIDKILTERTLLSSLHHPFIIHLHFAFQSPTHLFLVFDFVNGGDLYFHLFEEDRFSEERVRFYAAQIYLGLHFLHTNNTLYRDLKPENILVDRFGYLKMSDFGLSKMLESKHSKARTMVGTPEYLAPEMLSSVDWDDDETLEFVEDGYTKSVDWWSYGIFLFEMVFGYHPYNKSFEEDKVSILEKVRSNSAIEIPEEESKLLKLSSECISFLKGLLNKDPVKRLGYRDETEIQKHPFFKSMDWEALLQRKIEPPFIPEVEDECDLKYFDEDVTQLPLKSPETKKDQKKLKNLHHRRFQGYSFAYDPFNPFESNNSNNTSSRKEEEDDDEWVVISKEEKTEAEEKGSKKKKQKKENKKKIFRKNTKSSKKN